MQNIKGQLWLLPVPLSEKDIQTIPVFNQRKIGDIRFFVVERIRTARRFIRLLAPEVVIDDLTFFELNKRTTESDFTRMLQPILDGFDVGVMSEAGCPGIADPGATLVALAHKANIVVNPLVGPSSILLALMASGMNGQSFTFHGYLPAKKEALIPVLRKLEQTSQKTKSTQIFIETPYRNQQIVDQVCSTLAERTKLTIACDLTTDNQYVRTKMIKDWKKNPPKDLHKRPTVFLLEG